MKPRLKYAEAFPALDFERMEHGTALDIDGMRVTFEGWHYGHIWIGVKKKVHFLRAGDERIAKLRAATVSGNGVLIVAPAAHHLQLCR